MSNTRAVRESEDMAANPANRRVSEADPSTFAGVPEHERRSALRRRRGAGAHERLSPQERKDLLDALRTTATHEEACAMAGISLRTLESWLYVGEGKHPTRPATPWHKRLVREVRKAETTPVVLMGGNVVSASRQHPDAAVRYMLARYPKRFVPPDAAVASTTSYVQESTIIIPAERVPAFARWLARADLPEIRDANGRIIDPLAGLVHIEE